MLPSNRTRANPFGDGFNSPARDARHGHEARRVRNDRRFWRRRHRQESEQSGPEFVLRLESFPRFRNVTNDGLATFLFGQAREVFRVVAPGPEHGRAQPQRLRMVSQRRVQQRDGEFRVRELIAKDAQRRQRVAFVVVIAAALDRQAFQTAGIQPEACRFFQQRRIMRGGAKFLCQCGRVHDAGNLPQSAASVNPSDKILLPRAERSRRQPAYGGRLERVSGGGIRRTDFNPGNDGTQPTTITKTIRCPRERNASRPRFATHPDG